jgi:hemolysin activation/secretion protein
VDTPALVRLADAVAAGMSKTDIALYTVVLPGQTFERGRVRLNVVQGYVDDIEVTGRGAARRDIRRVLALAAPLKRERPLLRSDLEQSLSLIRDIPGLTADVKVLPIAQRGAVKLSIALTAKRFSAAVAVNDRGTAELGRTQVELDFKAYGLVRAGDQTQVTVAFPTDIARFQYYALSQSEPIGERGLTATANLGYLVTHPASVDISGTAASAGLQLSYPLIRRYKESVYLTGAIDGVNSDNALFGRIFSDERTRAFRATVSVAESWTKTSASASLTGSQGLNALGARVADERMSDPGFRKVNLRGGLDRKISPQWLVRVRGEAQLSGDKLPAAEQFSLGGSEFGRAFESALIVGDYGLAASAELAWRPAALPNRLKGAEAYAFIDGGKLWRRDRPGMPGKSYDLASTGFGARVPVFKTTVVEMEADRAVDTPSGVHADSWRFVLGLKTAV